MRTSNDVLSACNESWYDRILTVSDVYMWARGFYSKKLGPMTQFIVG
ncbi:hypothetical protein [Veillonella montpellierensis]|nr:hypothetical protein [Veillonella montpellierensis]